ncbi:hypothetical protein CBS101457_002129 [Exobasidium rhododendri]|nr:hypothetical protein CBS101457_002129 [Exobasidium rhododendri]
MESVRPSVEKQYRQDGPRLPSDYGEILNEEATPGLPVLPNVPSSHPRDVSHTPAMVVDTGLDMKSSDGVGGGDIEEEEVERLGDEGGDYNGEVLEEEAGELEEEEEFMEELEDDEIEQMDIEGGLSYDSASHLVDYKVETMPLLSSSQSICIEAIQSILRSGSYNSTQEFMSGWREKMLKASSDVVEVSETLPASPVVSSKYNLLHNELAIQELNILLKQLQVHLTDMEADTFEDAILLIPLGHVLTSLQVAKRTIDIVDSRNQTSELNSPSASHSSSGSPKDATFLTSTASSQQQQQQQHNRAQRGLAYGRSSNTGPLSSLIGSSPSTSREELRNPFSELEARPQSAMSDERGRERTDREADIYTRVVRVLENVEKRCKEVTLNLRSRQESGSKERWATDSDVESGLMEHVVKTWLRLQDLSKDTRDLFVSKRSHASSSSSNFEVRRNSGPLASYSPTYSPSRGRSRRSSGASLGSAKGASLHSFDINDELIDEAIAAGVGVGAQRSLSRLSNRSARLRTPSIPGIASSSHYANNSLLSRRESAKTEGTSSQPPRYSEDPSRGDFDYGWAVAEGYREADSSGEHQQGLRNRRQSSGDQSAYSVRTLPAYNTQLEAAPIHSTDKKKNSSGTSLSHLDYQGLSPSKIEEGAESRTDATQSSTVTGTSADHLRASFSTHRARSTQDLTIIQASIERLYSAVPQLENQRASSPLNVQQRQAQKQDEMVELIEKLGKAGRMEDQRALHPTESSSGKPPSIAASPEATGFEGSTGTFKNARIAKRLGSINFGSLSMRRATSLLGTEGKGKEPERFVIAAKDGKEADVSFDHLLPLAKQIQVANERGYQDQKAAPRRSVLDRGKRSSKLESMRIGASEGPKGGEDDDDDLFDVLSASLASSRMADQDAQKRPRDMIVSHTSPLYSPTTSFRLEARSEITAGTDTSLVANAPVGECVEVRSTGRKTSTADVSSSGVTIAQLDIPSPQGHLSSELAYVAETQPRLGLISVFLWTPHEPAADHLQYRVDPNDHQSLIVTYQSAPITFTLPHPTLKQQDICSIYRQQEGHWQFKLQMERHPCNSAIKYSENPSPSPLSAAMLQQSQPAFLSCNICLCRVAETKSIKQYSSLPSQHWEELVDAWMCHADQELSREMVQSQKKLHEHLGLQEEQGRVSEAIIVLHPGHLSAAVIRGSNQGSVSFDLVFTTPPRSAAHYHRTRLKVGAS